MAPPLKNRRSESTQTFDRIQKCLIDHRAKKIMFDYDDEGRITAFTFALEINNQSYGYQLPARVENVEQIRYGDRRNAWKPISQAQKDQAYRTAWANIRDWLEAQMALIDTAQVKIEEVFLPYMLEPGTGRTYYEALADQEFKLNLPPPKPKGDDGVIYL
jgi:hypothetical protein